MLRHTPRTVSSMGSVTFRSRLDGWVLGSLLSAAALQIVVLIVLVRVAPKALFVVAPLWIAFMASVLWLYRATLYEVTDDRLIVRSGIANLEIPLPDIETIKPTRNPMSAPAWSLDRLLITYGQGKTCMISPGDKAGFLRLLREREPIGKSLLKT